VEEGTDTKSLLKSTPNSSKLPKGQIFSQEQINHRIRYIVNDKMAIVHASRKANISKCSACYYYNVYKNDPEKKISSLRNQHAQTPRIYMQGQIENLIRYINDDKMTIGEASANMTYISGRYYHNKYLKDPNLLFL
jgi:hypothetical protein